MLTDSADKMEPGEDLITDEKHPILDKSESTNTNKNLIFRCLNHDCTGYMCAILSSMSFTIHALLYKINTSHIHKLQYSNALLSRMLLGFLAMMPLIKFFKHPFFGKRDDYKWILLSSLLFLSSSLFYYIASSMTSFADVIAIYFTQCAPAIVLAHLFLDEPFGWYEISIVISALVGVVLVAHPPGLFLDKETQSLDFKFTNVTITHWEFFHVYALDKIFASIVAFLATLSAAGNIVVLRRLTHVSVFTINFNTSLIGLILSLILSTVTWSWQMSIRSFLDAFLLGIQCISGVGAAMLLIVATRYLEAGMTSMLLTLEIVFAYSVQLIVLKEAPSVSAAVGAGLITLVCVIFGLKSYCESRIANRKVESSELETKEEEEKSPEEETGNDDVDTSDKPQDSDTGDKPQNSDTSDKP